MKNIEIIGARVHNLKNIDIQIPHKKLVVITGLSGSGKSSLAFDTIYAEGQRRYIDTFSTYAKQFLTNIERPEVDKIDGLSPVISIEQKTLGYNPRSTVGTTTEITDFMRLWFAKAAEAFSPITGEKMVQYTTEQIISKIEENYNAKQIYILAPIVRSRKGHYKELFETYMRKGYLYMRIDGKITELSHKLILERYKIHNIELVVDKLLVSKDTEHSRRLKASIELALEIGKGVLMIMEKDSDQVKYFSKHLMCPSTGVSFDLPAPNTFSFNSPQGYCTMCKGLGEVERFNMEKTVPNQNLSVFDGAVMPFGKNLDKFFVDFLRQIFDKYNVKYKTPFKDLPQPLVEEILYGSNTSEAQDLRQIFYYLLYSYSFKRLLSDYDTTHNKIVYYNYIEKVQCPECKGTRLKEEALSYKIDGKNIAELSNMELYDLQNWLSNIEKRLNNRQNVISSDILKEIRSRVNFLVDVGLSYLTLDRPISTLSGGESQRIRLATQIGSQLVNVLYILDEPSIGLHQHDNQRLINSLKNLRDNNNSIIVVEHDKDTMLAADYIIDIGPGAGVNGGRIVATGSPQEFINKNSLTAQYLSNKKKIAIPEKHRQGNGKWLILEKAKGNNLKEIDVKIPLGTFICVTGVSGSGKSTLVFDTLMPILYNYAYNSTLKPLPYSKIIGLEYINKVIEVDQSPIGKTTRSNPATYTKVFDEIRNLFAQLPESQIRGFKAGRFSFNVSGGRCETCKGAGVETIEMKLMPDIYITCRTCGGLRYNKETLAVRYKGKSIADILNMTINEAVEFFEAHPKILQKIKTLQDVGLGYLTLGQPSTTLSGGENQRVKLAAELSKISTGKTIYFLDEPTTGMHFEDINMFLQIIHKIVDKGNTVIIVEHNMDIIKNADYIVDLGPGGGKDGGKVVFEGFIDDFIKDTKSLTAYYLRNYINE